MQDSLEKLISQWESDNSLFQPDRLFEPSQLSELGRLSKRLEILDRLDAYSPIGDLRTPDSEGLGSELHKRARAICARLEAANAELYRSICFEIQRGICPAIFSPFLKPANVGLLPRGIGYDYLDELVSGVLQLDEPANESAPTGPENVFYQPTPARHIFALIAAAAISANDVLVDLGSGLGHVPLLVSACTGISSIGVELEPSFVASARQCAERLNLGRVSFLQQEAQDADFSSGTIFYLYTPFTGSILRNVLSSLKKEAASRPIQICTFGPCTLTIAQEPWLEAASTPETDRITIFCSCS